jgi:hypothetical protein
MRKYLLSPGSHFPHATHIGIKWPCTYIRGYHKTANFGNQTDLMGEIKENYSPQIQSRHFDGWFTGKRFLIYPPRAHLGTSQTVKGLLLGSYLVWCSFHILTRCGHALDKLGPHQLLLLGTQVRHLGFHHTRHSPPAWALQACPRRSEPYARLCSSAATCPPLLWGAQSTYLTCAHAQWQH